MLRVLRGWLSAYPERLERGTHRITVKNRIYSLYDVARNFEKVSLVFDGNQRPARTVVHPSLQRFGERAHRLDVSLDAHVAQNEHRR